MSKETYAQAKARLFQEFRALGCQVKDQLKVPKVFLPNGEVLLFKAQALHTQSNALSTWIDIRCMPASWIMQQIKAPVTREMSPDTLLPSSKEVSVEEFFRDHVEFVTVK